MNRIAYYHVVKTTPEAVWIVDEDGPLSVTNDAESVVTDLHAMQGDRRIFYRDTQGDWSELKHEGSKFTGFGLNGDMAP